MKRYHKAVYIPEADKAALEDFTAKINKKTWRYSIHCLDKVKYDVSFLDIITYIKNMTSLKSSDIFEYYTIEDKIEKACYRIAYRAGTDIILVIDYNKTIVTIYTNEKIDTHSTLNRSLYERDTISKAG